MRIGYYACKSTTSKLSTDQVTCTQMQMHSQGGHVKQSCANTERLEAKDAIMHESTMKTAFHCAQLCTQNQDSELESPGVAVSLSKLKEKTPASSQFSSGNMRMLLSPCGQQFLHTEHARKHIGVNGRVLFSKMAFSIVAGRTQQMESHYN